jgi:hypothetical protein
MCWPLADRAVLLRAASCDVNLHVNMYKGCTMYFVGTRTAVLVSYAVSDRRGDDKSTEAWDRPWYCGS